MSELRRDPIVGSWVIIAPERGARPRSFTPDPDEDTSPASCPFCEGNEHMTPRELFAIRDGGEPDRPGWYVRAVPNKFPSLEVRGSVEPRHDGLWQAMDGLGAHEVVIESPRHEMDLAFSTDEQIIRVITACQARVEDLRRDQRFRHVFVFRNHRLAAGASVGHPHSQVMAVPIVPDALRAQLAAASAHFAEHGECVYCRLLADDVASGLRVIWQNDSFVAVCPYASRYAFAATIFPRRHSHDFLLMEPAERADLASMLRRLLVGFRTALFNPPYNLVYQIAPSLSAAGNGSEYSRNLEQAFHWHIDLTPRLTRTAGFERGTGLHLNPVAPEEAAKTIRANLP